MEPRIGGASARERVSFSLLVVGTRAYAVRECCVHVPLIRRPTKDPPVRAGSEDWPSCFAILFFSSGAKEGAEGRCCPTPVGGGTSVLQCLYVADG